MRDEAVDTLRGESREFWKGLARLSLNLPRLVDADLREAAGISLSDFSILVQLYEDGRLSVSELARRVGLSISRVSRAVGALEHRGLATRQRSTRDGRGQLVSITDAGVIATEIALPIQAARGRQLARAGGDDDLHGPWLNRIADRVDAEGARSTLGGEDPSPDGAAQENEPTGTDWVDALASLVRAMDGLVAEELRARDITPAAWSVLECAATTPRSAASIGRICRLTDTGVAKILARFAARGWIRREADENDQRAIVIILTDEGRRTFDQVRAERARRAAAITPGMSETDREVVTRIARDVRERALRIPNPEPTEQRTPSCPTTTDAAPSSPEPVPASASSTPSNSPPMARK